MKSLVSSAVSFDENTLKSFQAYMQEKPSTLILIHANPDGDTFGAGWALYHALLSQEFDVDMACKDDIPESFHFIGNTSFIKHDFNPNDYKTFIFVDCGDKRMTQFHNLYPEILSENVHKINLDHHPSNDLFGDINGVFTKAASTTEIVYHLLLDLHIHITPSMATALLLGLYTDTGAFMHQNTTPHVYQIAGDLLEKGANMARISKQVFRTYDLPTLKLWGRILQNVSITPEGAAIVGISREEYESLGLKRDDISGVIDYINALDEVEYVVMLSEDEKGNVKGSLRTRKDHVDLKALAEQFGGGGHVRASGFTIPKGRLQKEVRWKIIQE